MSTDAGRLFGRSIAFPPRLGPDGRWAFSEGEDNIRESIRIILTTEPGERLNLPEFGARLRGFLFSPNTPATRRLVRDEIETALRRWEPRISLTSVSVDPDEIDERTAIATVRYSLVATRAADQLQLSVSLGG